MFHQRQVPPSPPLPHYTVKNLNMFLSFAFQLHSSRHRNQLRSGSLLRRSVDPAAARGRCRGTHLPRGSPCSGGAHRQRAVNGCSQALQRQPAEAECRHMECALTAYHPSISKIRINNVSGHWVRESCQISHHINLRPEAT